MSTSPAGKNIHLVDVVLGKQPRGWIRKPAHRSFASREWIEGQVKFGKWITDKRNPGDSQAPNYLIYVTNVEEGSRVLIKITHYLDSHVSVEHIHLISSRRR